MGNEEIIALRNRILGLLIRSARERRRFSRQECADALGVSVSRFTSYENGARAISLPEMELLGRLLETPLHQLRREQLSAESDDLALPLPEMFLRLRDRIVGAQLRQARLASGRSQQNLAEILGRSVSTVANYEYGERPIPLAELEVATRALGVSLEIFFAAESEVGIWHRQQQDFAAFAQLEPDLRAFILRPINRSYLELAMKLSEMPVGSLRMIAEGLLEITF